MLLRITAFSIAISYSIHFIKFELMKSLLVAFFIFCMGFAKAQEGLTYFGVQFKPIIPSNLFRAGSSETVLNDATYSVDQKMGYSFGGVVRHDFKNWLSVETGISYVHRNYSAYAANGATQLRDTVSLSITGYEIPLMGLVYVKLDDQIFMDAGFGLSFDMFPSNVYNTNDDNFEFFGNRRRWINAGLITNIGWEFRTKEKGSFYIGGSYHRPFQSIYRAELSQKVGASSSPFATIDLSGNYLTVDLRYFFPGEAKDKKEKLKLKKGEAPSWMNGGKGDKKKKK